MLQRAASNAYSWWWASHIRTKQSKWLEQNLHDMEDKVDNMMRIIEGDGDSFAKRAEMYYKKRPELVEHVEESFRAYRALAEKYDHLSKEFQGANRTIASIFPERVHYTIDDDDDDDCEVDFFPQESSSTKSTHQFSSEFDGSPKLGIPEVPKFPKKNCFRSPSMIRKTQLKRNSSSASSRAVSTPKSGLNKTEALEEIDMLQKEILARQTEMEFVKSLYERECEKYWEMEDNIATIQKRVENLQDEFGIGTIIADNEARSLMATTTLKSCRETLAKLQEEHEKTIEETRLENNKINDVDTKFESLKCTLLSKQIHHDSTDLHEDLSIEQELKISDQTVACTADDKHDIELLNQKIREHLEMNSNNSFTISELAEKIDELVNKIVTLEIAISSQTSLVRRLKSETNVLQENIQELEEGKEILVESSENMKKKIKELEAELARVKNLNQNVEIQNNSLQTQFSEASCNLDHLCGRLHTMNMDEEAENFEFLQDVMMVDPDVRTTTFSTYSGLNGREVETSKLDEFFMEEEHKKSIPSNENFSVAAEKANESIHEEKDERPQPQTDNTLVDMEANELHKEEKHPTLRQLFLKGLEDRENILLDEYTSVLRNYKDVRNKLSEVEEKNRDSIFELAMQVKELKDAISSKDDVIKSLVNNVETDEDTSARDVDQELPQETILEAPSSLYSQSSTPNLDQVSTPVSDGERGIEPTERSRSLRNSGSLSKKDDAYKKAIKVDKSITMSPIEERFRSHIDGQLKTNLEFWLRFSTTVHQIQKFQTSIQDLQSELQKLRNIKKEGSVKHHHRMESDARPIYTHLREIQTELSLWLEHNAILKDELCSRFSSLCDIQDEISRITDQGPTKEMSDHQAAKFQGEVLNMTQENRKITDELQVGQGRVRVLQVQVEKALERLDQEFGISATKNIESQSKSLSRTRIPLRSFLFGIKLKRRKPSLFSCVSPQLENLYSDIAKGTIPQ